MSTSIFLSSLVEGLPTYVYTGSRGVYTESVPAAVPTTLILVLTFGSTPTPTLDLPCLDKAPRSFLCRDPFSPQNTD